MGTRHKARPAAACIASSVTMMLGACASRGADKAGGRDQPESVVLTLASNNGGMPYGLEPFVREVEQLSGGTLRLDYTDDWRKGEPGQEASLVGDVKAGRVDMASVGARVFDSVGVTSFQALVAPLLVDSYDLEGRVFDAGIPGRMLERIDTIGLTGIGVLPGPMRAMTGISHPFVKPSDFDGAVVGTSGGTLAEQAFRALGATPKLVPAVTTLDGLDGLDYQLSAVDGNRYYKGASHVTANLDLWPRPHVIFMAANRFARLTHAQQDILRTAAANAIEPALKATRDEEADAGVGLCAAGMTVDVASESDLAALIKAVGPIYAELGQDSETQAFLDEIRALKAQVAAPAESFACPPIASSGGPAATPIDGVYQVTTTVDDIRRPDDPNPPSENYGAWIYVFDRGRFAITQESEDACTWGYGTYVVTGDRVEWSFIDGGGIAPHGANNRPGEHVVFGWSLYRDMLTLTAVPGEVSPENFWVKPWRRTDAAPSASVFGTRCPPPPEALPPVG